MMKKTLLLLVALLFAGAQVLQAQRTITGTVISAEEPLGIPGVTVQVKGTTTGTATNINGEYTINVPAGATLIFSSVGMQTQEIEVGAQTRIDVTMTSGQTLDEVVISSYGSARKVGNTVGSVQQVTAEKLQGRPAANVMDALQGQVAGLQVFSGSGEPTEVQSVRLHGVGSLTTSSTPLYIVDGLVVSAGAVLALNPNDFESVTVLKDASATSIYGARAANGVIVITTKRGIRNQDARITVRTQWGVSQLAESRFYDQIMSTRELLDFFQATGTVSQSDIIDINNNDAFRDAKGSLYDTRWWNVFMRDNVPTSQTDISVQGGSDKTMYFVSGGHYSQEGTAYGSSYDRFTARSNVESQAKDWLKVGMNLLLSRDKRHQATGFGQNFLNAGSLIALNQPWIPAVNHDGSRRDHMTEGQFEIIHPEYRAEMMPVIRRNSQLTGGFFVEISPMEGLKIINRSGTEARDWFVDSKRDPRMEASGLSRNFGQRAFTMQQLITMTTTNVIEYTFNFDKEHNFTTLIGQEGVLNRNRLTFVSGGGIEDYRMTELHSAMNRQLVNLQSGFDSYAFFSLFGNVSYDYKERFFGDFTLRNDQSSRFGKDNRSAWFWSLGGRWNMTNESFIRDLGFISNLSTAVSYGTQGNSEIGDYTHLATVGIIGSYRGGSGFGLENPGNPKLMWESQSKFTAGFRTTIVRKYDIEFDFYNRRTTNMLLQVRYPYTSGFASVWDNVGSYNNTGVDLNITANIVRTRDYSFGAGLVFNYNVDRFIGVKGSDEEGFWWNADVFFKKGAPGMWYLPMHAGIDPATGAQRYYVPGEDMHITSKGITTESYSESGLLQNTGMKRFAPMNGGFTLNGSYKGFQVFAQFAYTLGKWMFDNGSYFYNNPNIFDGMNASRNVLDYWTPDNPNAKYPNWANGDRIEIGSDFWMSNASFMRLKNLTLAYNFDRKLLDKTGFIRNARVFYTGRNLLTFTKYSGVDPEPNQVYELGTYLNSRQHQIGIEFTF